jgi:hypothetical protein
MNSPSRKPASGTDPHRILPSNFNDCNLSSSLTFLRSLSDRRREGERLDAIATCSDWDLEVGGELKCEGRRQGVWTHESRMRSVNLPA